MTDLEYFSYFEGIARQLKAIGHTDEKKRFARIDIEEVLTGLRNKIDLSSWCLFLECFEGQLQGKNEVVTNYMTGAFILVRKCGERDFDQQAITISEATALSKKIIARMIRDKHQAIQGNKPKYLRGIDISAIEYQKVGPLFDSSAYGRRVEFRILENEALVVDPEDWDVNED